MDRFIENQSEQYNQEFSALKSNMDRFIGMQVQQCSYAAMPLKSNMDRFIVSTQKEL